MAHLLPTDINFSATAWGPQSEPHQMFKDIPYAPFSKGARLGTAADWMNITKQNQNRPNQSFVSTAFNAFDDEEDDDFSLVDNRIYKPGMVVQRRFTKTQVKWAKPVPRVRGGTNFQIQGKRSKIQQKNLNVAKPKSKKRQGAQKYTSNSGYAQKNRRRTEHSTEIQNTWTEKLSIELNTLKDTHPLPSVETLSTHGKLEEYNPHYDAINVRQNVSLERNWIHERKYYNVTTSEDPILSELMQKKTGTVYATDSILAILMAAPVSVYSWDLILTVKDGDLIFDARPNSYFDLLDVNENSNEPPLDEDENPANSMDALSQEATFLNQNFSQQLLFKTDNQVLKFPKPHPFASPEEKPASVAYIYRSFDLGDDITIVARTEVNGYKPSKLKGSKPELLFIRALNEYDPKITGGWRKILESQKAGAFATELKNNNNKLTKWLAQAHLSGAREIKLGYVSRSQIKDPNHHVILDVSEFSPEDFAHEIATSFEYLWGSLKNLLEILKDAELSDGRYCLMRDPTKKLLSLFEMPSGTQ